MVSVGPPEIRELNTDNFRLDLKNIEDSETHMPFLDTHKHNQPVTVGGVTLARVVEIINGYTITFENGTYAVNLNGSNNNIGDVLNLNNVQVRSNNSAGLTFSKQTEDQSFTDSRVYINTAGLGQAGTQFPLGTPGLPVNNLADAQAIIVNRTLPKRLFLRGNLPVTASESVANFDIQGVSPILSRIIFEDGSDTDNCVLSACDVSGQLQGNITAKDTSTFSGLQDFEGTMISGGLGEAVITLDNTGSINEIQFIKCYSLVAGISTPVIDCKNLIDLKLSIRGYHGGIEIRNFGDASMKASLDIDAGNIFLNASCTAGTIKISGTGCVVDNSAGTEVNTDGFVSSTLSEEIPGGVTVSQLLVRIEDMIESAGTFFRWKARALGLAPTGAGNDSVLLQEVHKAHFNLRTRDILNQVERLFNDDGTVLQQFATIESNNQIIEIKPTDTSGLNWSDTESWIDSEGWVD